MGEEDDGRGQEWEDWRKDENINSPKTTAVSRCAGANRLRRKGGWVERGVRERETRNIFTDLAKNLYSGSNSNQTFSSHAKLPVNERTRKWTGSSCHVPCMEMLVLPQN